MKTYGLIGYPLGHSFSCRFFNDKFLKENRDEQYLNFELEQISLLSEVLRNNPELTGLNVTIPYKERVISLLDRLDPVAAETGAVNTIRISGSRDHLFLEGFNTDVHGFASSILPLLKPWHKSALILGTGGAARAARYAFGKMGIHWLQVSRNPKDLQTISYDMLDQGMMEQYTVIVNTTPLGTFPHIETCPVIPYHLLSPQHLLYDLVYNPAETRFLALGHQQGAMTKNGYEMLEKQALRSYEIWNYQEPE